MSSNDLFRKCEGGETHGRSVSNLVEEATSRPLRPDELESWGGVVATRVVNDHDSGTTRAAEVMYAIERDDSICDLMGHESTAPRSPRDAPAAMRRGTLTLSLDDFREGNAEFGSAALTASEQLLVLQLARVVRRWAICDLFILIFFVPIVDAPQVTFAFVST